MQRLPLLLLMACRWNILQTQYAVKEADVGRITQVRGGSQYKDRYLPLQPGDPENVPYILATTEPPDTCVRVIGWAWGWEIKKYGDYRAFRAGRNPWHWLHTDKLHDLCELPEDNFAWLRSLPRGYARQRATKAAAPPEGFLFV
jgi:hypothetical protein